MQTTRSLLQPVIALASLALAPAAASSQVPEKFENLKVLPKDVSRQELLETMRGFSFELDVRCEHCHVGGPALSTMSFASDEKKAKRTARQMLAMTREINETQISKLEGSTLKVSCFTCHRGVLRPEPIESLIGAELRSGGLEAAIARYRELRGRYLEAGSYSFAATPMNRLGESLLGEGRVEWAVAILELNAEYHPKSRWLHELLGDAYLKAGNRERARAAYERLLSLSPDDPRVKAKLEELRTPSKSP